MILENTSFQLFSPMCVFPKHSSGRKAPVTLKADFGLRKSSFASWNFFRHSRIFPKKNSKKLPFSCWGKSCSRVPDVLFGVIFGTEKKGKSLRISVLCKFKNLERGANLVPTCCIIAHNVARSGKNWKNLMFLTTLETN